MLTDIAIYRWIGGVMTSIMQAGIPEALRKFFEILTT
jgi:hypothetical protein